MSARIICVDFTQRRRSQKGDIAQWMVVFVALAMLIVLAVAFFERWWIW